MNQHQRHRRRASFGRQRTPCDIHTTTTRCDRTPHPARKRIPMSFQSLADVFAYVQSHDLTSNEVLVLTAIAHHADRTGANAYPTLETLRTFTKLHRRAIQYALRRLEKAQVLTTTLTRG